MNWIVDRGYVRSAKGARLLPSVIGLGLFLESNLTCLISGAVARPLFDRFSLSREKLAYLCDSTAHPCAFSFRSMLTARSSWASSRAGTSQTRSTSS